jgi:Zn-dependent protease
VLLGEPPRTRGDIHFALFGFPVRIHPLFWLMALILGYNSPGPKEIAAWVAAVLISILVHELGHALVLRACGLRPSITLHGLGGVTSSHNSQAFAPQLRTLEEVVISAAGPAAGFLLAAAVAGLIRLAGRHLEVYPLFGLPCLVRIAPGEIIGSPVLTSLLNDIFFTSVIWGLLNLLPVYPLDGGQIARELFLAAQPRDGLRHSLIVSLSAAAAMAVAGLAYWHDYFVAIFFGYLAFQSYAVLQATGGHGRFR